MVRNGRDGERAVKVMHGLQGSSDWREKGELSDGAPDGAGDSAFV